MGKKAKTSGVYFLNGHPFVMEKGQVLPDGAEIDETAAADADAEVVEERAEKAAPENRKKSAPENRAK